jgi:adenosine kinase
MAISFLMDIDLYFKTEDVEEIAQALSELPKKNTQRVRVVIITQGADPTILAMSK